MDFDVEEIITRILNKKILATSVKNKKISMQMYQSKQTDDLTTRDVQVSEGLFSSSLMTHLPRVLYLLYLLVSEKNENFAEMNKI